MIGYWVVVAVVGCAVAVVLVAIAADESPGRSADAPQATRRPVWVALGASDGAGEGTPDPARDNWVAQLASRLPVPVEVHNFGESGSTLTEARRRQLPAALVARPDVVTAWLAVNDLASGLPLPSYERELAGLLSDLDGAGCCVVLGNVPDLSRVPALAGGLGPVPAAALRLAAKQWNAAIARVAAAHGAEVVDLFAEPPVAADFGADGFHPSPIGHRRLAERFRPSVERALAAAAEPGGRAGEADGSGS